MQCSAPHALGAVCLCLAQPTLLVQVALLKKRAKDYSYKVFKRTKDKVEEKRTSYVCMQENGFYVDTVKAFRDRRCHIPALPVLSPAP